MLTREETIEQVCLQADTLTYPALTSTEVGAVVDRTRRFAIWTAATAYVIGDRVVPVSTNGRIYECVCNGTSSATEPDFPNSGGYSGQVFDDDSSGIFGDGNDLLWADVGTQPSERWDHRMATRSCFLLKAARCTSEVDSNGVSLNQLVINFIRMANLYKAVVVV